MRCGPPDLIGWARPPVPGEESWPQPPQQVTAAAKSAFLSGGQWAYPAAIIGVLLGTAPVFCKFPRQQAEVALLDRYQAEDSQPGAG
jgi:DHA2 family multidrug resistance protein-like MFS transporter